MESRGHGADAQIVKRKLNLKGKIIDFSANINPLGPSKNSIEKLKENMNLIEKYPDISYYDMKNAIKEYERENLEIDSFNIILGNGASEIIYKISEALKPKKALIIEPSFSEYEESLRLQKSEIDYYILKEENDFILCDDFLDYIKNDIDIIFLCNPNNPTGKLVSEDLLKKIMDKSLKTGSILVIDESFIDFTHQKSSSKYLKEYSNLIILKSLTKFFASPGIRSGYALVFNKDIFEKVSLYMPSWNINAFSDIYTRYALKDRQYIKNTKEYIQNEKEYLEFELSKIKNIKVFKTDTNFILFKASKNLKEKLILKNILIRDCSNFKGLSSGFFRIAVKSHSDNKILIDNINLLNNAVVSFSGGKDSMLCLYKAINKGYNISALLVTSDCQNHSNFHRIPMKILDKVSKSLGIRIINVIVNDGENYEEKFEEGLRKAKKFGASTCIFGDIDIDSHKVWGEDRALHASMDAEFPLWNRKREEVTNEFIKSGFKAVIKKVNLDYLSSDYLNEELDFKLVSKFKDLDIDVCGENGEYHTFVYDGPLFKNKIDFKVVAKEKDRQYAYLKIE
ncbi:diphthine--ammonia ligase [Clostridium sp. BJN0001]|uniref:aminotransferase class I/II-fold pyridoxal phosphate-dependent enzyme n=1 Tax=Clostridium sp. BJN0001 TaxID=2930219 RepID=UPI001FCFA939|nr:diphthine--ammonia ligase [Clostridium sp. BJN0001]